MRKPEPIDIRTALPQKPKGFLDQFRVFIRSRGLAYTTEKTYLLWAKRFIRFCKYQSPKDFKLQDIDIFLNYLAQQRFCSPNTQATALNALILLYREFLGFDTRGLDFNYAKRKPKVPTVLSKPEADSIIQELSGVQKLVTQLMYGSGLRVSEALNLRVKDIDFANGGLFVMEAKGDKSRRTLLPSSLHQSLHSQIAFVEHTFEADLAIGKALARVFRARMLAALAAAGISLPPTPNPWVVQCQQAGYGDSALKYLSRYLYRGVLSDENIISDDGTEVTFRYTDSKANTPKTRTLNGEDFLKLLLQHVLPKGFRRVRDYGFLHGNAKATLILIQWILQVQVSLQNPLSRARFICPHC